MPVLLHNNPLKYVLVKVFVFCALARTGWIYTCSSTGTMMLKRNRRKLKRKLFRITFTCMRRYDSNFYNMKLLSSRWKLPLFSQLKSHAAPSVLIFAFKNRELRFNVIFKIKDSKHENNTWSWRVCIYRWFTSKKDESWNFSLYNKR